MGRRAVDQSRVAVLEARSLGMGEDWDWGDVLQPSDGDEHDHEVLHLS